MRMWAIQKSLRWLNGILWVAMVGILFYAIRPFFLPSQKMAQEMDRPMDPISRGDKPPETSFDFPSPILGTGVNHEESGFRFCGVAGLENHFFALIEYQNHQMLVQEGDRVGDWTIQKILSEEVVLQDTSAHLIHLSLSQEGASHVADKLAGVNGSERSLHRQTLENIVSHWGEILREVKIMPFVEKGQTQGFLLLNIRSDSLLQQLGFHTGDVVQKINGQDVTNLESLLALSHPLDGEQWVIDVRRGPKNMQLVYRVEEGR
ncbi:MAG: hypothetical protein HYS08_02410 [Chlamydiae bacterium]|nr:hypothetical protein [Chlamydiota bacterium]MBI3266728.1 hypothetical protein [Chlamydiota bacterium]